MQVNDPETLREVEALFARYEAALMANDLATLDALFWQSPHVLRYGSGGEALHGIEAIAAFRAGRVGGAPPRALLRTVITTFGTGWATANTEFRLTADGRLGRQSQTWARLPEGWRIVAAHVSMA